MSRVIVWFCSAGSDVVWFNGPPVHCAADHGQVAWVRILIAWQNFLFEEAPNGFTFFVATSGETAWCDDRGLL